MIIRLPSTSEEMKITSPAFGIGGFIPVKYSCDGENVNPPLIISDAPKGTTTFVLIMDDPDAPRGAFTHWVEIFPANTREIPENYRKAGGWRITNDAGKEGYIGPCPPDGQHTYRFKLYAVDLACRGDAVPWEHRIAHGRAHPCHGRAGRGI
jgi:Raf kinase inhibitor-like YbhB/YbcL family protein